MPLSDRHTHTPRNSQKRHTDTHILSQTLRETHIHSQTLIGHSQTLTDTQRQSQKHTDTIRQIHRHSQTHTDTHRTVTDTRINSQTLSDTLRQTDRHSQTLNIEIYLTLN